MTEFSEAEAAEKEVTNKNSRSGGGGGTSGWPDSQSLWADIPTSQSFHSDILHQWKTQGLSPPSISTKSQTSDNFFDHSGIDRKRHAATRPSHPSSPDLFKSEHDRGGHHHGQFERFHEQDSTDDFPSIGHGGKFGHPGHGLQYQPPEDSFHYNVRYEEEPEDHVLRPKRQPQFNLQDSRPDFGSGSPPSQFGNFPLSVRFDYKTSSQQPESVPNLPRPNRHITSYPAEFQAPQLLPSGLHANDDDDFDFKPAAATFQSGFGGKSHSYTTFQAPKVANNVFIDHSGGGGGEAEGIVGVVGSVRPSQENAFQHISKKDIVPPSFPDAPYEFTEADDTLDYFDYEPSYPPYLQNRGQIDDERFDRQNKEENGLYEINNYHQPIRGQAYDIEEPLEIQQYETDYGGLETFRGGYDSENDADRGIVRSYR